MPLGMTEFVDFTQVTQHTMGDESNRHTHKTTATTTEGREELLVFGRKKRVLARHEDNMFVGLCWLVVRKVNANKLFNIVSRVAMCRALGKI